MALLTFSLVGLQYVNSPHNTSNADSFDQIYLGHRNDLYAHPARTLVLL
jgi:hypothetical protein